MTSKEIESRSGVAKANIRYYEAEGLLQPAREKNGYRDYSEDDLAVLEKIKLLRRLGVSIEELKELAAGTAALESVLERRLGEVQQEQSALKRVEQVCGAVRDSGETYATLNAEKYLRELDADTAAPVLPEKDRLPMVFSPWKRFFARTFDEFLWSLLLVVLFCLFGVNPAKVPDIANTILMVLVALALEPALIALAGTTPGKALLGMRLGSPAGGKLTMAEAYSRHFLMLWEGVGFYIPIWSWIQMYRSLKRGQNEEPQPWDAEVAYYEKPLNWKYITALGAVATMAFAAAEAVNSASQLPPNRGELTVAEFAENYNRQNKYLDLNSRKYLDESGAWQTVPEDPNSMVIYMDDLLGWDDWSGSRDLIYTVEDGQVRAITMQGERDNCFDWVELPVLQAVELIPAYVWAQEEAPFWSFHRKRLLERLEDQDWSKDFEIRESGVVLRWEIELDRFDYAHGANMAIPTSETGENHLAFRFTIESAHGME